MGHLEIVRELCVRGANVNAARTTDGYTSLMWASFKGHLEIVRELCVRGANVNAARTDNGFTSLMWASQNGHLEVVRELCVRGANVNAARTGDGFTSLMWASYNGHLEIVRELCVHGADVNAARTNDGYTSLMLASNNGKLDVVRELCDRGANVNAKSKHGYTALLLASDGAASGYGEIYLKIVSLLLTNLVITKELQGAITETEDIVALTKKINDSFKKAISPDNPENAGNVLKNYSPKVQKVYIDKLKGWNNIISVMNSRNSLLPRDLIAELAKYGGRKRKTFRKSKKKLSKAVTRRS
jgi:ankyrin repeat protein